MSIQFSEQRVLEARSKILPIVILAPLRDAIKHSYTNISDRDVVCLDKDFAIEIQKTLEWLFEKIEKE